MNLKNKSKKKIIITACNSNIGKDLVNHFIKKKYNVLGTYKKKKYQFKSPYITYLNYEFKKKFLVKENFDMLIHCASLTPYKYKISNKIMKLNYIGFKKILNSKSNFKKIVLLSTISVYGETNEKVINENSKIKKVNAYGKSKIKMEKILINYCKRNKTDFLILRLPGVIGNFKADVNFINNIIKNFSQNKSVKYRNPDSFFNNVIHTDNIAKISENFLIKKNVLFKNKIFNLCSLKPIKLKNIINKIKKQLKSKSKIKILEPNKSFQISTKKCEKYGIDLLSTYQSIKKNINFILN